MDSNSLSHTKWNCKYHIVFAPKYRRKCIFRKNCAYVPEERSAIPLQTEQSSAG